VDDGDVVVFDGKKVPHQPGDIFKVKAGKRTRLIIQNFIGSAGKPIVFINSGGVVDINSVGKDGSALDVQGCKHVRVTGSGFKGLRYGFKLACGKKGPHALNVRKRSSSIEIDHIEVYAAGFAGFNVKDEPSKKNKTTRSQFTMRNISLHDNYVHDVRGEGFYIGHTFFTGYDPKKIGNPIMPHVIEGLRIYNNVFHNTGCEGLQVGSATKDCEIYNNTITASGKSPFAKYQDNGMQIGSGTQGWVYNNFVGACPSNSLVLFGHGDVVIENNIFRNAGKMGMYINTKGGNSYQIRNNTIISPAKNGAVIGNWKKPSAPMTFSQNLILLSDKKAIGIENQNKKAALKDQKNVIKQANQIKRPPRVGAVFKGVGSTLEAKRAPLTHKKPNPWKQVDP